MTKLLIDVEPNELNPPDLRQKCFSPLARFLLYLLPIPLKSLAVQNIFGFPII
jgi:hypothetical protein